MRVSFPGMRPGSCRAAHHDHLSAATALKTFACGCQAQEGKRNGDVMSVDDPALPHPVHIHTTTAPVVGHRVAEALGFPIIDEPAGHFRHPRTDHAAAVRRVGSAASLVGAVAMSSWVQFGHLHVRRPFCLEAKSDVVVESAGAGWPFWRLRLKKPPTEKRRGEEK